MITGDITQIDLANPRKSGLLDAINILGGVEGVAFCHFEEGDVVRHPLVQRIVRAYESAKPQQQELPLEGAIAVGVLAKRRPPGGAGRSIRPSRSKAGGAGRGSEIENEGWDRCDAIPAFAVSAAGAVASSSLSVRTSLYLRVSSISDPEPLTQEPRPRAR